MKTVKPGPFRPFLVLVAWWKRRRFYYPQEEDTSDCMSEATSDDVDGPRCSGLVDHPQTMFFNTPQKKHEEIHPASRLETIESFQDSVESMDSLVGSHVEHDDESSQDTTLVSNTGYRTDFLVEHLGFLSAQTQPREVEIVYNN